MRVYQTENVGKNISYEKVMLDLGEVHEYEVAGRRKGLLNSMLNKAVTDFSFT